MRINECHRCEGSGHIVRNWRWEMSWASFQRDPAAVESPVDVIQPRCCPDCAGTGALIEWEVGDRPPGSPYGARFMRGTGYNHATGGL